MVHNDQDDAVPWYQGIEMFLALRRLDKEVYLFNYNGEFHGLRRRHNQKDWTIRMQQFFDHHLKGAPANPNGWSAASRSSNATRRRNDSSNPWKPINRSRARTRNRLSQPPLFHLRTAHFARPAVVAFRRHLVARIVRACALTPESRVLSIGCGLGDTELLLAPRIGHLTGIDIADAGIAEARAAAAQRAFE
jgi:SAM-dependent methyltransferase